MEPSNPIVREFVTAINAGDRARFQATLAADAAMSDDGTDRDLSAWTEREIFSSSGTMSVVSEQDDGLDLVADFSNSTWGKMRTRWRFTVDGDKITRFDTGQA